MKSSINIEIPHMILKYRNILVDLFPEKFEEINYIICAVSNRYLKNYDNKNEIANRIEIKTIKSIERRIKFLIEKFRDLLVLKHAIKELKKEKAFKKYDALLNTLERIVTREIKIYAKRLAEEKMKIEAIREYGLKRHSSNLLLYIAPITILFLLNVLSE